MKKCVKTMDDIDDVIEKIDIFKGSGKEYKFRKTSDILRLCKLLENEIPAMGLLKTRLENGGYIEKIGGRWRLFDAVGEIVVVGDSLRQILIALIWVDC